MKLNFKPCGDLGTNCYILSTKSGDIIIDPGMNAASFVLENAKNPIAILNTHGHYDHVWSNKELKEKLNIPIYIHKEDAFFLERDIFGLGVPTSEADFLCEEGIMVDIKGVEVKFMHFPGHTPGCSMIEIGDFIFSGDFIFKNSIGRSDLPYSSDEVMLKSLKKFRELDFDKKLYPGHGESTTIKNEQKNTDYFSAQIRMI